MIKTLNNLRSLAFDRLTKLLTFENCILAL